MHRVEMRFPRDENPMKVKELMTQSPLTARPDDDVDLGLQIMAWGEVRHLPVLEEGRLVGIVSDRLLLANQENNPRMREIMSSPPQVAHPDEDVEDAAARMVRERLGCLPVVLGGDLVGIGTVTDVISARAGLAVPRGIERMTVGEAMTPEPVTVLPDDLFVDAIARMSARNVRHAPVVDGDGRVVGMLSDRDARLAVGNSLLAASGAAGPVRLRLLRVRDVMSRDPIVMRESDSLAQAAECLRFRTVGALPVVDRAGKLTGILSYIDILDQLLGPRGV